MWSSKQPLTGATKHKTPDADRRGPRCFCRLRGASRILPEVENAVDRCFQFGRWTGLVRLRLIRLTMAENDKRATGTGCALRVQNLRLRRHAGDDTLVTGVHRLSIAAMP